MPKTKATHGGPNRGQGRKPKPPELLYRKRRITLPPDIDDLLVGRKDVSKLIAELLRQHFISGNPSHE